MLDGIRLSIVGRSSEHFRQLSLMLPKNFTLKLQRKQTFLSLDIFLKKKFRLINWDSHEIKTFKILKFKNWRAVSFIDVKIGNSQLVGINGLKILELKSKKFKLNLPAVNLVVNSQFSLFEQTDQLSLLALRLKGVA